MKSGLNIEEEKPRRINSNLESISQVLEYDSEADKVKSPDSVVHNLTR